MSNNMTMGNDERETYTRAIEKATESKAFDRILHIVTIVVFVCVAAYVIVQQAAYQADVRSISQERTRQYNELIISQDAIEKESDSIKEIMACLKRLPVQPDEASITICVDKIKGEN